MGIDSSRSPRMIKEVLTTHGLHDDIHKLIASINAELRAINHQVPHYGELQSMLHAHMLCHALAQETRIYVEVNGKEYAVKSTRRRIDSIGRVDNALILEAV